MEIGIRKKLAVSYDEALAKIPPLLKEEGFGVLTEIDVKDTLSKKLGVDFRRYRILGACNPTLAYEALQKNLGVGVMMPCNVVVTEDEDKKASVIVVDPMQTVAANAGPELKRFAEGVKERLVRVVEKL